MKDKITQNESETNIFAKNVFQILFSYMIGILFTQLMGFEFALSVGIVCVPIYLLIYYFISIKGKKKNKVRR